MISSVHSPYIRIESLDAPTKQTADLYVNQVILNQLKDKLSQRLAETGGMAHYDIHHSSREYYAYTIILRPQFDLYSARMYEERLLNTINKLVGELPND